MADTTIRLFDGCTHTSPELREEVQQLQALLTAQGLAVSEDGYFGRETEAAVLRFQREHDLDTDGIVGPRTWAALRGEDTSIPENSGATLYAPDDAALLEELALAEGFRASIEAGATRAGVPASVVCGIGSRESRWGLALRPPGSAGTGDRVPRSSRKPWRDSDLPPDGGGFGRGLMQIDFDAHDFARTGSWQDPGANIAYGCRVLRQDLVLMRRKTALVGEALVRAAVAAYNCGGGNVLKALERGRDIDYYTAGRDYSRNVLDRAGWFELHGW